MCDPGRMQTGVRAEGQLEAAGLCGTQRGRTEGRVQEPQGLQCSWLGHEGRRQPLYAWAPRLLLPSSLDSGARGSWHWRGPVTPG